MEIENRRSEQQGPTFVSYCREELKAIRREMHDADKRLVSHIGTCARDIAAVQSKCDMNKMFLNWLMSITSRLVSLGMLLAIAWKHIG